MDDRDVKRIEATLAEMRAETASGFRDTWGKLDTLDKRIDDLESDRDKRKGAEQARRRWMSVAWAAITAAVATALNKLWPWN